VLWVYDTDGAEILAFTDEVDVVRVRSSAAGLGSGQGSSHHILA
jgi:hypothetical protein